MLWKKDINYALGLNSSKREFEGWLKILIVILAVGLSLFQLYTAVAGIYKTAIIHRSAHLLLVLLPFFLIYPIWGKASKNRVLLLIDGLIVLIATASVGYVVFFYEAISGRVGNLNNLDLTLGIIVIVLVLEATRRINMAFFILALISITYILFGSSFPGMFAHSGIGWERFIFLMTYSTEGIFGVSLGVSSTYLFLFILFGVFLERTGAAEFFIKLALSLVGRFTGGPAKTALVSSALMGSIMGSSIANVVTTGAFTIPLMKKTGFKPRVAGAIEAVASSGGQFLPPVMGAGAFIMAEVTGIPYSGIVKAALVPAILYFISLIAVIHFEAKKHGLKGLPADQIPNFWELIINSGYLMLPLITIIYLLLGKGFSATKAGVIAIFVTIIISYFPKGVKFNWRDYVYVLEKGARNALEIAVLTASMGIVISALILTGLSMRFTSIVLSIAGGELFIVLLLIMGVCLILGMGLPTPVAYLVMAMFAAPSLVDMGVPVISAHLFIFFFAIKSGVTPPIAITAVVAAGVAQANWLSTSFTAFYYSLAGFIIAYMFIYSPQLLLITGSFSEIVLAIITATIGVISFAGFTQGWFINKTSWLERILLLLASVPLIKAGTITDLIGLGIFLIVVTLQMITKSAERTKKVTTEKF